MSDAARLEALGADRAEFTFRGRLLSVELDVDKWPGALIRNPAKRVEAVDELLGGQDAGLGYDAVLDDYRELSDAMAAAVGISRLPEDPPAPDRWFGGVPTLLRLLEEAEPDVELDLRRIGVDYRDRWRDKLTLRQIWTYIRRSQPTSAIAVADNAGNEVWTEAMFIGANIYQALTGKVYPGRPLKPEEVAELVKAMQQEQAHVDKLRERQAAYASTPPAQPASATQTAMQRAMENRRRELGLSGDGS